MWLAASGLAAGLLLFFGLIGMLVTLSMPYFWPRTVYAFPVEPGGEATAVGWILRPAETRAVITDTASGVRDREMLVYGTAPGSARPDYRILSRDLLTEASPAAVHVLVRSQGRAWFGRPVELSLEDGRTLSADHPDFETRLEQVLALKTDRQAAMDRLRQNRLSRLNREFERLHARRARLLAEKGLAATRDLTELDRLIAETNTTISAVSRELDALEAEQNRGSLTFRFPDGSEATLALAGVRDLYRPAALGFVGRLGHAGERFLEFLTGYPGEGTGLGGIFPALFGTVVMTLLMSVAVMPFGVLAAIYLREYAAQGRLVTMVRVAVNNMAGIPSIVYGVFGLGFFIYGVGGLIDTVFFRETLPAPTFGTGGILWASLTLALLTLPVVIVATEEALIAVPPGLREGSLACGATQWQTLRRVVLPAAGPGMLTGLILAMARGAGEVAPLMLVGVVMSAPTLPVDSFFPFVHLDQKFMHLGYHIYSMAFQAPDPVLARSLVFATALILVGLILFLNLGAILLRNRLRKNALQHTPDL
ncbi:MAG: phosphate ABC transporter permease PstA [Opitutales bacterium]